MIEEPLQKPDLKPVSRGTLFEDNEPAAGFIFMPDSIAGLQT